MSDPIVHEVVGSDMNIYARLNYGMNTTMGPKEKALIIYPFHNPSPRALGILSHLNAYPTNTPLRICPLAPTNVSS
jgi:hypothetical protein